MDRFVNKSVIVTGAGHGIGRAVAERFAAEGARVAVNDVSEMRAQEVAAAIGPNAIAVTADVSSKSAVDGMFSRVLTAFGGVDILINNAGLITAERHFLEGDEQWWDTVLGVNLKG